MYLLYIISCPCFTCRSKTHIFKKFGKSYDNLKKRGCKTTGDGFSLTQALFRFFYMFALIEDEKLYWSPHVKMQIFRTFDAILVWLVEMKGKPRSRTAKEQMLRQSTAPGKHKALEGFLRN